MWDRLERWRWFKEFSVGRVGMLKDWLIDAVMAILEENYPARRRHLHLSFTGQTADCHSKPSHAVDQARNHVGILRQVYVAQVEKKLIRFTAEVARGPVQLLPPVRVVLILGLT
jgi:hypothetical protein